MNNNTFESTLDRTMLSFRGMTLSARQVTKILEDEAKMKKEFDEDEIIDKVLKDNKELIKEVRNEMNTVEKQKETIETIEATVVNEEIEELRSQYQAKFGKEVGPRFKNDPEWIKKQLSL